MRVKKDKIAVILPIVLIIALAVLIANIDRIFPTPSAYSRIEGIMKRVDYNASNIALGTNPNASVTVVEFSDFQCPACAMAVDEMHKLMDHYGDRINFVFKHFPVYRDSEKAAEAAECAGDQGKFWEYHDLLFVNPMTLDTSYLVLYAKNLGLDVEEFNECLTSGAKLGKVKADFNDGYKNGITGTPTFFINDIMLTGVHSFEEMKAIIDKELERVENE